MNDTFDIHLNKKKKLNSVKVNIVLQTHSSSSEVGEFIKLCLLPWKYVALGWFYFHK